MSAAIAFYQHFLRHYVYSGMCMLSQSVCKQSSMFVSSSATFSCADDISMTVLCASCVHTIGIYKETQIMQYHAETGKSLAPVRGSAVKYCCSKCSTSPGQQLRRAVDPPRGIQASRNDSDTWKAAQSTRQKRRRSGQNNLSCCVVHCALLPAFEDYQSQNCAQPSTLLYLKE